MSEELNNTTQGEAVNSTDETTSQDTEATAEVSEQSIGEVMGTTEKEEPKTVGLDKFLDIKKENKALKRELKDIASRIDDGGDDEIAGDIESLADEHNIDRAFLKKLAKNLEAKAAEKLEATINEKLAPITQKEKQAKVDAVFAKAYDKTMERMPEYNGIANPEVIKALATNPANAKKTLSQIMEEAYGGAIQGKPTIETTKAGGGKQPEKVDFNRAQTDSDYFKQVMDNPKLKAEYNSKAMNDVLNYL